MSLDPSTRCRSVRRTILTVRPWAIMNMFSCDVVRCMKTMLLLRPSRGRSFDSDRLRPPFSAFSRFPHQEETE